MEKIKTLVELLLAAFDVNHPEEIIGNCIKAYTDTETFIAENDLSWLPDHSPTAVLNFALPGEITHWMVYGDKIDELHARLAEQLEDDFPGFPQEKKFTSPEYFTWLDEQLLANENELELMEVGNSFSDEWQVLFVRRENSSSILELATALNIHCARTVDLL